MAGDGLREICALCVHVACICMCVCVDYIRTSKHYLLSTLLPSQEKDLRNKLNKRKLVVMNVAREDHLKLAQLFEVCVCMYRCMRACEYVCACTCVCMCVYLSVFVGYVHT